MSDPPNRTLQLPPRTPPHTPDAPPRNHAHHTHTGPRQERRWGISLNKMKMPQITAESSPAGATTTTDPNFFNFFNSRFKFFRGNDARREPPRKTLFKSIAIWDHFLEKSVKVRTECWLTTLYFSVKKKRRLTYFGTKRHFAVVPGVQIPPQHEGRGRHHGNGAARLQWGLSCPARQSM